MQALQKNVTFQVLAAASMNMTALWNVQTHSLVEVVRRFRAVYCFHHRPDYGRSKYL
jgi:hypothetical protein